MARTTALFVLLCALAVLAHQAEASEWWEDPRVWWYKGPNGPKLCPGDFPRTPDKCAPCTCGYRPGPGGGDLFQYPIGGFTFPFIRDGLTCATAYQFLVTNPPSPVEPISEYCDAGFQCVDTPSSGPWCCPTTPVQRPAGFRLPNNRRRRPLCNNRA